MQEILERHQIGIYFLAILLGVFIQPNLTNFMNVALGFMLFVTFLQIPITQLHHAFKHIRFISALFVTNFIAIPILVGVFSFFLPTHPLIQFAIVFVLLAPCVDYVISFTDIGKGNAKLLLALTPVLLIVQMFVVPFYMHFLLGQKVSTLISLLPFLHALVFFIFIPLILALITQLISSRIPKFTACLNTMPVPATALVIFIVVGSVMPQIELAKTASLIALPFYILYAIFAPYLGYIVAKIFKLDAYSNRAILFSSSYRNSFIILPIALAVPNAMPIVPAVILTQTLVELCFLPVYVKLFSKI